MLLGKFNHTLDDKNRLIIPSKLRKNLAIDIVLSLSFDANVIVLRSKQNFQKQYQELTALPNTKISTRQLSRHIFSSSIEAEVDSQGRIIVPANLLSECGIKKDVTIVGMGDFCEIWDSNKLNEELKRLTPEISKLADKIETKEINQNFEFKK